MVNIFSRISQWIALRTSAVLLDMIVYQQAVLQDDYIEMHIELDLLLADVILMKKKTFFWTFFNRTISIEKIPVIEIGSFQNSHIQFYAVACG